MLFRTTKSLVITLLFVLCTLQATASKNYPVRDRLLDYSIQFAEEVLHSPSDIEMLRSVRPKEVTDSAAFNTMRLFGRGMFVSSRQTMAFEYFKQALAIIGESEELTRDGQIFKAYCYLLLGAAADETGLQQLSMEYYLKGLKIAEKVNSSPILGDFYNNIGVSYFRTDNYAKAEPYFKKGLENNLKLGLKSNASINYINLSTARMQSGDFDGAVDYALKAIQNTDEKENPDDYYSIYSHIGSLYLQKKEFDMAYTWLTNAYRHQLKLETKAMLFETCLTLMDYFSTVGKPDSLERYKRETSRLVEELDNPALRVRFYESVAKLYHSRGDVEKAYEMTRKLIALKDSVYKMENLAQMEQAHDIYQIEKKAIEQENGMEKWNPVVVFFTMGGVVLVMAGLLVWIIIIRHRSERVRREKDQANASLAEIREQNLRQEREQKEKAERDLNEQQRRLTAVTLEKIRTSQQIDEALTEAKQVLLKIPPRDRETQLKLKAVISKLEGLDNEANWEEFQHCFTMVHPEFYRRLDEKHPGLTPKDRKLCALIALGLSTKDIASVTFRELRSVETSRNRLRKRLELSSDVNLEDYMHHFAIGNPASGTTAAQKVETEDKTDAETEEQGITSV